MHFIVKWQTLPTNVVAASVRYLGELKVHKYVVCPVAGPVIDKVLAEFDCPEDLLIRCTVGTKEM